MTLQINEMALIANGYKHVAEYITFEKDWAGKWHKGETIDCFQKGNSMVIKINNGRRHFTFEYTDKNAANRKVNQLLKLYDNHYKKIR